MQESTIKVKSAAVQKIKNGYPLLRPDDLIGIAAIKEEGTILRLVDERNHFIAKAYYGRQNKGCGWLLTNMHSENVEIDQAFFEQKIKQAFEARQPFFDDENTTAFRAFNGEGDGIGGLTIDYYDGYYVITWYSKGIFAFKEFVLEAITHLVEYKAIYQKKRFDAKGQYVDDDDFVMGEKGQFPLIVKESGANFAVDLNDGAMVGVFLDQREVRKTIREHYAEGKTVLNLFSYTGAFSVFAALGGATQTTSVDLANRSKPKTIEQFSVNGIDYEAQQIIVEDVFHYMKYANRKQLAFDLVIVDPPSFAKSKKMTFSASKDYTNMLKQIISITKEQGLIVASTNAATFDMKRFKQMIDLAFKESDKRYAIVETFSLPRDFKTIQEYPEGDYLKVVFIQVK